MISDSTRELKNEMLKSLGIMRTLRDEIRLQLHLASMDVKTEWEELEPRVAELERAAAEFTEATHAAVTLTVERLSKLRKRLS